MDIISILSHSGGNFKTTTTVNLGASLARMGKKILSIDLDPQGGLSNCLTNFRREDEGRLPSITDVLLNKVPLEDVLLSVKSKGVKVVPAGSDLRNVHKILLNEKDGEYRLRKEMNKLDGFDIVLLDHAPGYSILTLNGLYASDWILVPIRAEFLSLDGIPELQKTIDEVFPQHDSIDVLGFVIGMYDPRTRIEKEVSEYLQKTLGAKLFKTKIRKNTKLREAPAEQIDIYLMGDKRGMDDFDSLAKEVLKRIGGEQ